MELINLVAEAIFFSGSVYACINVFLSWRQWRVPRGTSVPRRWLMVRRIGLVALTMQFLIFVPLWLPLRRYHGRLEYAILAEGILFVVAGPCAIIGNMHRRWWIFGSSGIFPVVAFLAVLFSAPI